MKFQLSTTAAAFFIISSLFAQNKTQFNTSIPDFPQQQKEFEDWRKGKDLKKEKNWKWFKRWEDQMSKRVNANGTLPDEFEYFREATNIAAHNQELSKTTANTWIPVGPFNVPGTYSGSWLDAYGIGRVNTIAFHPTDSNTYWVGVAQGGVWKTTNGGTSYTPLTDNLPILRISDICVDPIRPDTMYISVCDYAYIGVALTTDGRKRNTHYGLGVFKTTDGGQTWNPTGLAFNQTDFDGSLIRRIFLDPANPSTLVAAGTSGVWKSTNGGSNWSKTVDSLIWDIEQDPLNKNILFASGGYVKKINSGSACILKSTDFGSTWTMLNSGIPLTGAAQRIELAISPTDPNFVYALCCDVNSAYYGMYRTTNGGSSWTKMSSSPNILASDSTSGGGQGTYDLTMVVDANDKNTIYTGGLIIYGSTNGGATFKQVTEYYSIHPDQHFFRHNPLNNTYYLCNDGGIYKTQKINLALNTTQWTRVSDGLQIPSYYRVSCSASNPDHLIAGAQDNGTVYFNGTNWTFIGGGDGMDGTIEKQNAANVIYSSQFGYFEMSTDTGHTSSSLNITGESGEWTTPIIRDPNNDMVLYAGYENIHQSVDGGNNWSPISSLSGPPISAIAVSSVNPSYIYFTRRLQGSSGFGAEAWMTSTGGGTWTNITSGLPDSLYFTSITADDSLPSTAWITCGSFYGGVKVFKTTNGGNSWTNISYNLPNLPVNTIARRAGAKELYIGCDVGVYMLTDGQNTWQTVGTGLPNVIVSDLEIYNAGNKMYCSTFGRGIWSIDLGDSSSSEVQNIFNQAKILISPSPNNGEFNLNISQLHLKNIALDIIDISGRKVYSQKIELHSGNYSEKFILRMNSGLYFAKFSSTPGNSRTLKFVVK